MKNIIPPRQAPADTQPPGDIPPEVAALLHFTPVPRRVNRPDGWTADRQQRFIVLLAETGSPQRAAVAMGKQLSGIEPVYRDDPTGEFRSAWDQALAIGAARQRAEDAAKAGGEGDWRPPHRRGDPPRGQAAAEEEEEEESSIDDETKAGIFDNIVGKYIAKVRQEREARQNGRIVEADFTLRQITCTEIALDLMAEGFGLSAFEAIRQVRRGGHDIFSIAETGMSRLLDDARRSAWVEAGEPERPEHPARRYLVEKDGFSISERDCLHGGPDDVRAAEIAARDQRYRDDAAAQIAWEQDAHAAWAARQPEGE